MRYLYGKCGLLAAGLLATASSAGGTPYLLVSSGGPQVTVFAPGEGEAAGRRLAERIEGLTGGRLPLVAADGSEVPEGPLLAVGTPAGNAVVRAILDGDHRLGKLGEEGYLLKAGTWNGRRVLVAAGKTMAGAQNAVSELLSWKLMLGEKSAAVPGDLDQTDAPELKYRILWTSDGQANWSQTVEEMHTIQKGTTGTMVVPYTREGFLTHFKRSVDFISDHKINGYIIWGFLRGEHGGLEAGRELSRYARQRNVRILPGVCTQAAYGGFIYSQTDRFSLVGWLKMHPELCGRNKDGKIQTEAICPSKPANQQWLREGTEWLFNNLPDIGGVNLENGDLMECYTDDCVAAKADPANDPNFLWDMTATQKPVIETSRRLRPDAWLTFATYVGFSEATLRGLKDHPQYPPRFLTQYPAESICQWTYTGMTTPQAWPEELRPPPAAFREHIGLLHHGSLWGAPVDPGRWWAAPGAMLDDCSSVIQLICARIKHSGLPGVVIKGQTGATSPANEINYLALEYFGWHPDRTYDEFLHERLALCYGSPDRAGLFLRLLHNTARIPAEIEADRQKAHRMAESPDLDIRQRTRWRNLADELNRRKTRAEDPATFREAAK